ncbi:MAG: NAD kinase [Paludibacteraceae bacterium]|nr:NAD kinase [Paludibacteraceae bacterium]
MNIAIFGNAMKQQTLNEVQHLIEYMADHQIHIYLSQELRQELNLRDYEVYPRVDEVMLTDIDPIDFALSVGGDGTFLTTAAAVGNKNVPILGINCGHLGFLAEVQTQDVDYIMDRLLEGDYTVEQRQLLAVTCSENGRILDPNALNEVAIMKQGLSSMITIDTRLNGEFLHSYEADGLIVATATGSTAYNMSVGGPLMTPQTPAFVLSPIASHSLNVRPLVIPDDSKIDLSIRSRNGNYLVSVDGRSHTLSDDIKLHIEKARYTVRLVQIGENGFIHSLKVKLNWGK